LAGWRASNFAKYPTELAFNLKSQGRPKDNSYSPPQNKKTTPERRRKRIRN
jgi:hypothetical protein